MEGICAETNNNRFYSDPSLSIFCQGSHLYYYGSHLHGSHLHGSHWLAPLLRLTPPVLPLNSSNIQFPTESIYTYLNNPLLDKPLKRFCPTPYICGVTANTVGTSRSTPPPLAVPMQTYITSDPTVQLL